MLRFFCIAPSFLLIFLLSLCLGTLTFPSSLIFSVGGFPQCCLTSLRHLSKASPSTVGFYTDLGSSPISIVYFFIKLVFSSFRRVLLVLGHQEAYQRLFLNWAMSWYIGMPIDCWREQERVNFHQGEVFSLVWVYRAETFPPEWKVY